MLSLTIRPSGAVQFIYHDELRSLNELGTSSTVRVSHVEPCAQGWTADMGPVKGPVLGPFELRSEALAAEVQWLEANLF